jgi:serine/threonine protein phosphatase PrpC
MADVLHAIRALLEASRHARPDDLPAIAHRLATDVRATDLIMYLVDYDQTTLTPQTRTGVERLPLSIDTTLAGRVFATGQPHDGGEIVDAHGKTRHRLWLPLIHGSERLGVLEFLATAPITGGQRGDYELAAGWFAQIVATCRMYGDALERTRRRQPMQLAAEIVWNQLPALTFATAAVAVSAVLEPCYDVGGDAFDYAVNGDTLHIGIFDSVGHGINASALTALVVSAYRNARRCGLDLSDTYRSIDKWVHDQYPEKFCTAVLAELDITTGDYRKISAGHPGELLLRDGKLVKELPTPTALPLGLGHLDNPIPAITEDSLQPGDRILLYTDGVIEARTATGEQFGIHRLRDFVTNALTDQHPAAETMRRLIHAILAHQHDDLQDDASAVLIEWHPYRSPTHPSS